jgi:hypothetical protein
MASLAGFAARMLLEIAFESREIRQPLLQEGDEVFGDLRFEVELLAGAEERGTQVLKLLLAGCPLARTGLDKGLKRLAVFSCDLAGLVEQGLEFFKVSLAFVRLAVAHEAVKALDPLLSASANWR